MALVVCAIFAISIGRGSVTTVTILAAVAAACLSVAVFAYRAEIDSSEIRVRYFPFYTKRTPTRDVTQLIEARTLILITTTSKIPLRGLSSDAREVLFQILPHHLGETAAHESRRRDSALVVRRHVKWTLLSGCGFLATAAAVIPFLAGFSLHNYWDSIGKYFLILCLVFFILFIFEAGFTYVSWSSKRAFDKIERDQLHDRS